MKIRHAVRETKQRSKAYIENVLTAFAEYYTENMNDISEVQFMKQDMRGVPSISFYTTRHTITRQMHFTTYAELMAYVEGYLEAKRGH